MKNPIKTLLSAINIKIKDSAADWNQNDNNADSYIKNRPFWKDDDKIVCLLEEQTLNDFTLAPADQWPVFQDDKDVYLYIVKDFSYQDYPMFTHETKYSALNKQYIINWDGVEYICDPWERDCFCLGNGQLAWKYANYSKEPFMIAMNIWNEYINVNFTTAMYILSTTPLEQHTISISYIEKGKIHTIPKELLPSLVGQFQDEDYTAEIFNNYDRNIASQPYSHAEGDYTTASGVCSHAEGNHATASSFTSHAEGNYTTASGICSHAEGNSTKASGNNSHAEGHMTIASGNYSHAEGQYTTASGNYSHAESYSTTASGNNSHAEGSNTKALGLASHAEGNGSKASGSGSHAEGYSTTASGNYSHTEGWYSKVLNTDDNLRTAISSKNNGEAGHAEGFDTRAIGFAAHAEGDFSKALGLASHAEGNGSKASGSGSHAEGYSTTASGNYSHAEGYSTTASGNYSHAEGYSTTASGNNSHAEGSNTTASGSGSHTEGYGTVASGGDSHAEGYSTTASGNYSHAEGQQTAAKGICAHAEGISTVASGQATHAEGQQTVASGLDSHAEGVGNIINIIISGKKKVYTLSEANSNIKVGYTVVWGNIAAQIVAYNESTLTITLNKNLHRTTLTNANAIVVLGGACGNYSHSEGICTIATTLAQHVQGKYNILDIGGFSDGTGAYAHIVGNGTSETKRSNAHTLGWDGNAWFQGDVYVGSTSGTNKDNGSKKLATEDFVTTSNFTKPHMILQDEDNGFEYVIKMKNGTLVSFCRASSIAVTTLPKVEYVINETFDIAGTVVTATCQDSSTREVAFTYAEPDMTIIGEQTITVTYNEAGVDYTTTFTITITNPLTSIAITTQPTTVEYTVGDTFSTNGMVVTATYTDGNTTEVTPTSISEPDMTVAGEQTITVTYTENDITQTAEFTITVVEAATEDETTTE